MAASGQSDELLAMLGEEYRILGGHSVAFDGTPGIPCHMAEKVGFEEARLAALVCSRHTLPRVDLAEKVKAITVPGLLKLKEHGPVFWRPEQAQAYAFIYPRQPGPSLQAAIDLRRRLSESEIIAQIIAPALAALRLLYDKDIAHGAIRPGNMYVSPAGSVVLGDFLSAPGNINQPPAFLTVENLLATPAGRGAGTTAEDIYALGAVCACLVTGQNPFAGMSESDAFNAKVERGSYTAFIGRQSLPGSLGELLRGMLEDDATQRMPLDVAEQWAAGRRVAGVPIVATPRPPRGLIVEGIEYFDPRAVAEALSRSVPEAMRLISNDELIKWVRRTLRDVPMAQRLADAVNMPYTRGKQGSYENRLVARIILALHPTGPIRYNGVRVMPEAIGILLQKTIMANEPVQALAEIIAAQLPLYWYNLQSGTQNRFIAQIKAFEQCRFYLDRNSPGSGIERCLYELSPATPLIGEGLDKHFICTPQAFVNALEEVAGQSGRPSFPLGRHGIAFLAARASQLGNRPFQRIIAATHEWEKSLGALQVFSAMQKAFEMGPLTAIASWLGTLVEPCVERYHNRQTREHIRHDLRKAAAAGQLAGMIAAVDNVLVMHQDRNGYVHAGHQYEYFSREIAILNREIAPDAITHLAVGREAATVVSGVVSVAVLIGTVILQIVKSQ